MGTNFIEPIQITNYPLNIFNLLVNPPATRLAFSCQVFPSLSIKETADRQAAEAASGSAVYEYDKLYIRNWNQFLVGTRFHPFIAEIVRDSTGVYTIVGTPRDILFGLDSDAPSRLANDGTAEWSFSRSGNKFAFARQYDETSAVAWSTNYDIFTIDLTVPNSIPVCITENNLARDINPRYSPTDENVLVYLSQSVPGFANDQNRIKLYNGRMHHRRIRVYVIFF